LQQKIEYFTKQFGSLTSALNVQMKCKCRENLVEKLLALMPNTAAFDPLPEFNVSSSAPTGGK